MDGPYLEEVEGRGGGWFLPPSLHECQQFEQHIHFLNQNAVIPHEKKKYQILLATYQQPLQFAMFLVQHLKTTFAK